MDTLQAILQQLQRIKISDCIDIILVAFLFYKLIPMVRSTGALRIVRIVGAVLVIAWVTELMELHTLNFLVNQLLAVGLIALVVLFQPELRRMLEQLSNMKLHTFLGVEKESLAMDEVIAQTVMACEAMSRERVGALIVFAREGVLDDYAKTGTTIDAQVSEQLLRNIFFPKASLHDGAVIIRDERVAAAGCVLPLSDSKRLSADLGTRHRAGVGISEVSDAVVVIVSEENGVISVAVGGMLKRHLAPQTLEQLLRRELCPEAPANSDNLMVQLRQKLQKKHKEDDRNEK